MSFTAERLYELLPAIHRIRDDEQGKPLRQLLEAIAQEVAVLEENLAQLYDDQFIETCADWVTPYIGGLIGYRSLHGKAPRISSPRADVANTIAHRRRKGTATMLEQLARDVTGWDARVVEFFELLVATQHMNHLRPHSKATPDLRAWEPLERLGTAFDSIAHTVDVRRISNGTGRFNIPNIGVFLWRLGAYSLTNSPTFQVDQNRYLLSPLGNNMSLFTNPEAEEVITHLAEPINVPAPISRRVLAEHLRDYYGNGKSLQLTVFDEAGTMQPIGIEEIHVCNLSNAGRRQRISITGLTGQTFTLSFAGETTDEIASDATVADIQTALESLSTIEVGDISVEGEVAATAMDVTVSFRDSFVPFPVPVLSVTVLDDSPEVAGRVDVNWAHADQLHIAADPVLGRVWFPSTMRQLIQIRGHRSGTYQLTFNGQTTVPIPNDATVADVHAALQQLENVPPVSMSVIGDVDAGDIRLVVGFSAALGESIPLIDVEPEALSPNPAVVSVTELPRASAEGPALRVNFHYGFGANLGGGEYSRELPSDPENTTVLRVPNDHATIQAALDALTGNSVVEITDSGLYEESLSFPAPTNGHLQIRAGDGHRPTIHLRQPLDLRRDTVSDITLDGLVLTGAGVTVSATDNLVDKVTLRHCTLVPGLALTGAGEPMHPTLPSLIVANPNVTVIIEHCIVGAIHADEASRIVIRESIVDATDPSFFAFSAISDPDTEEDTDTGTPLPGGEFSIENSTVIGRVFATQLPLVSNTIFHASGSSVPVRSVRKQIGCVRFSYLPPGAQVPRRYRCQPDLAIQAAIDQREQQHGPLTEEQKTTLTAGVQTQVQPAFNSLRYGAPAYCQLRQSTPIEIRRGADDESEMGVFHQVFQPQRETNVLTRLDEYLRFGLEAGLFYET